MNEIRKQWIAALRSGKYKQGRGQLRSGQDEFCCLGVLCDVFGMHPSGLKVWPETGDDSRLYGGRWDVPTVEVQTAAGLANRVGSLNTLSELPEETKRKLEAHGVGIYRENTLAQINDSGVPFSVIADIIEYEPEGLFEDE